MKYNFNVKDDTKSIELTPDENGYELKFKTRADFQPLYDNVIIERDLGEEKTAGGILLTEESRDNTSTGTVVAVGNGRLNENTGELTPLTVKVGDRVLFVAGTVQEFECGSDKINIIREKDILSIIR